MWQFKPKTIIARLLSNIFIIYSVFENPELMEKVCGPFTLPISHKRHLLFIIIGMQLIRIIYASVVTQLQRLGLLSKEKLGLSQFLTTKYVFILIIKIVLIFDESHRKKFYLHTCLLEGAIIGSAVLFDCFSKENIKQVGELLIIEGLHRLALVYVLTQTFCPNLILYYSITNLMVFILSQVEAQSRYGLNKSLYVKHDIYRFLFLSLLFFAITSITQISSYGFKTLIVFILALKWHINALQNYDESKFTQASWKLLGISALMASSEFVFAFYDL